MFIAQALPAIFSPKNVYSTDLASNFFTKNVYSTGLPAIF
jgi:hypothetical protein